MATEEEQPASAGSKKTLHVNPDVLIDLQFLKRQMGLKSLSDVVETMIQLYNHTEYFPRAYVEFVDSIRQRSEKSDR